MGCTLRVVAIILLALVARLQAQPLRLRTGIPDACMGALVPCAQINELGAQLRLSGLAAWPAPAARYQAGGALGLAVSISKTFEIAAALPLSYGPGFAAGPLDLTLRFRVGPRMGVPPLGRAWPADEPYPRAIPVDHEVRPARGTLALGLHFSTSIPGLRGAGAGCTSTCTSAAAVSLTGDLRLWRFLLSAHGRVGIADLDGGGPGTSAVQLGGRAALYLAGDAVALFTDALAEQQLAAPYDRGAALVVGGQLGDFRSLRLTAWYAQLVGSHEGSAAGLSLDIPFGIYGYDSERLARLTAAIDPFVGGDGWMYSDGCAPMFRVGPPGATVWNEHRGDHVAPGTHLWQKGSTLYRDEAAKDPYMPVLQREWSPPPAPAPLLRIPWPSFTEAQRYPPLAQQWLRRYALGPDPERRAQCAELMAQLARQAEEAARAPTLQQRCERAKREADQMTAGMLRAAPADEAARVARSAGLAAMLLRSQACSEGVSGDDFAALAGSLRPTLPVPRPSGAAGQPGAARPAPPKPPGPQPAASAALPGAAAPSTAAAPGAAPGSAAQPPVASSRSRHIPRAVKREVIEENKAEHGGVERCVSCGAELVPGTRRKKGVPVPWNERNFDHQLPHSRGGPNTAANIDLKCFDCNVRKGKRNAEPWVKQMAIPTPRRKK